MSTFYTFVDHSIDNFVEYIIDHFVEYIVAHFVDHFVDQTNLLRKKARLKIQIEERFL